MPLDLVLKSWQFMGSQPCTELDDDSDLDNSDEESEDEANEMSLD